MNILENLKKRGIFNDITNKEKFLKLQQGDGVYIGFDPTATSLHLGNYIQISILKRFEAYGFKVMAVLGGATGMIGDPSFKKAERESLSKEQINLNKDKIKKQLESFGLKVIDNYDFYKDMNFLDFLRDIGKLININYMISKKNVISRLDKGLSFTEFAYQLIQGWDFKKLYDSENVKIQVGGSDQWGNITTGIELIRKTIGTDNNALGITTKLLTDSQGEKFGKSLGGGGLWLDKEKKSPFAMYQFFINQTDSEVQKLLMWLTYLKIEQIEKILNEHAIKPWKKMAQKILSFEITKDLHGEKETLKAMKLSEKLFNSKEKNIFTDGELNNISFAVPTIEYDKNEDFFFNLVRLKVSSSKRELRQIIKAGSVEINGVAIFETFDIQDLKKINLVKQGKRNFFILKKG